MKTSIEWLKDYADIQMSPKELGDILTMTGSKVETITSTGEDIKNVVVGKILEIQKHPDADKLIVTKVDVKNEILQIVTGADNVKVGDLVPIAKNGSELPGKVKITTGKLRGIESCGMMCSVGELGLKLEDYPGQIDHGIMILPKELESRLGEDIVEVLELKEDIIDFEITPNRPDCLSIEGLGRETAVSLHVPFKDPHQHLNQIKQETKEELEGLKVTIQAPDLCYRYVARVVKNVKIGPSPKWLTKRLAACDIRSVNNIVDITNYVMLELGQPMHAFDIESIEGKQITVRRAKQGEKITTLDKQERMLDEEMLVIADSKKPVAVAGVMGGLYSEIESDTKTVVLESAVFYGGNVRKTAKKLGLRTEASSRYEKGLSPENAKRVVNRAVELIELLGIGEPIEGKIDVYPTKQVIPEVEFDIERINQLLGVEIPKEQMVEILERLGMKVENGKVIPPFYRMDIHYVADLAEEVVRFYGYDKLASTRIYADTTLGVKNKQQKIEDKIKQLLVDRGFSEIYTYAFLSPKDVEKANQEVIPQTIKVRNPLSEEYTIMRASTIPSMLQTLSNNYAKKNKAVKLFEVARTYQNWDQQIELGNVPTEEMVLSIGMYGENQDFYTLKGMIETLLKASGVTHYEIEPETNHPSFHPGKTANVKIGKDTIATLGEIHPMVLKNYGMAQKVYLAEVQIQKITKYAKVNKIYTEIPKFPAVERDIAIVVDDEIEVGKIEKIIQKKAKKVLESLKLFDLYRDEKLGKNKKSVAYALTFRAKEKTLTDEEINPIMEQIVKELQETLGAKLRS